MLKRFLEINQDGFAFHEPGSSSPFSTGAATPPKEIIFCDCRGVGVICHHVYGNEDGEQHRAIVGPHVMEQHQDSFKTQHSGPQCRHRRQVFVDVSNRPEAKLGMKYDEATDTFFGVE